MTLNVSPKVLPNVDTLLSMYRRLGSVAKVGAELGVRGGTVWSKLRGTGQVRPIRTYSADELSRLRNEYDDYVSSGRLHELAREMGRTVDAIQLKVSRLGLGVKGRTHTAQVRAAIGSKAKARIALKGHPRGATGLVVSTDRRARMGEITRQAWHSKTDQERLAIIDKGLKTKAKKNISAPQRDGASWRAGWRVIGGVRVFYRSAWEANYARYLESLKQSGLVVTWSHEPKTFALCRADGSTTTYTPDFHIEWRDGSVAFHEVKGWMDERSVQKLRLMSEQFSEHRIVVVDASKYQWLGGICKAVIWGWE